MLLSENKWNSLIFVNDGEKHCVAAFMGLLWFSLAWLGFSIGTIQIDTFDVVNVLLHIKYGNKPNRTAPSPLSLSLFLFYWYVNLNWIKKYFFAFSILFQIFSFAHLMLWVIIFKRCLSEKENVLFYLFSSYFLVWLLSSVQFEYCSAQCCIVWKLKSAFRKCEHKW